MTLLCFLVTLVVAFSSITRASNSSALCFPSSFLFGTASSAYQAEGGWNTTNKEPSIWDNFCRDTVNRVPCANVADDFIHRYDSDIALMKRHGYGTFRFSIAWARAMSWKVTTQRMQANPEGLAFYHSLVDELLANGIQPVMTLCHWDLPATLQTAFDPPGWLNEAMVEHFVDYAALIFKEFGQDVEFWTTFNEPASFILTGFALGYGPPKLGDSSTNAYEVAHNVLLAHAAAVEKFHELRDAGTVKSTARISIVINSDWGVPLNGSFTEDVAAAKRKNQFHLGWFLSPLTTGDYPEVMRERIGDRLPNFTEEQSAQPKGSYDLLMLNYYASYATTDCDSERSETNCSSLTLGWATDLGVDDSRNPDGARHAYGSIMDADSCSADSGYPPGYIQAIRFLHEHDTNADILLTENGWLHKAIYEEDIPIIGYTVWSFMDGFKWTNYAGRRGLYFVNFTDETGDIDEYTALPTQLTRIQRSAGAWYPNVATTGCFEQEEEDEQYLV
ncbi:Glycosyl hydrolase family 1 [Phytophthora infestans]|uniref:Glycosyl hydrolase family 1 n=1 Tax=Phytophthora infestans TaxID=4787 RepID=A0A8S9TLR5_PHYIN|nr:Glycosyl hydrolase family 1 [Phytophthora infestans]